MTFQSKKITVLSERIVLVTASGNANVELNTGQTFNVTFFWSFVYEKINNDWKVIQSHQSQAN
ncbi:MAG: nuclear transport factor 2 family protein [Bacteroidales bacterium]|nr:nuclear transport factor 2 family protein [Bacteroidales bacterium]